MGRSQFRCSVKGRARKGKNRVAVWQSGDLAKLGFWGEAGFVVRSKRGQEKARVALQFGSGNPAEFGFRSEVGLVVRPKRGQKASLLCSLAKRQSGELGILGRSWFRFPVLLWAEDRWQATAAERSRFQAKGRQACFCNRRGARGEVGEQAKPVSFPEVAERQKPTPKI